MDNATDAELQEAEDARMELVDERPNIVARMLSFMYTGDYNDAKVPEWASMITDTNDQTPAEVSDDVLIPSDDQEDADMVDSNEPQSNPGSRSSGALLRMEDRQADIK